MKFSPFKLNSLTQHQEQIRGRFDDTRIAYQIEEFYASNFYELLRNPDSGLWHLSSAALADLYRQEVERGFFGDPEEQS